MNIKKAVKVSILLVTALAIISSVASQLFSSATPAYLLVIGFFLLIPAGTGLSYLFLNKIIWPYLRTCSFKVRFAWAAVYMFAGLFLVFAIPLTIYPKISTIKISGMAQKNPQAKGDEVWLISIADGNKTSLSLLNQSCSGDWQLQQSAFVFTQNQPSDLICTVKSDSSIALNFTMHPWSGKARVEYDHQVVNLDLYSAEGSSKNVIFQVPLTKTENAILFPLIFADAIAIGVTLLAITIWAVHRTNRRPVLPAGKHFPWYGYAILPLLSWTVYLLTYWPGFMSPDTITQLTQVVSGKYFDWHPAFHTMTLWLITRVWFSPAAVAIVQIVILSGLIGWGLTLLEANGSPRWLSWAVDALLAVSPCIALMLLYPWKDIAYSIALLALTLFLYQFINNKAGRFSWIGLGIVTALAALYRHNGGPVAFGVLALLIVVCRSQWRPLLAALVLSIALWVGVKGPLYQVVNVNTTDVQSSNPQPVPVNIVYLIYTHYQSGTPFLERDRQLLQQVVPGGMTVDPVVLSKNTNALTSLAARLTLENPRITFQYYLARSAYIFQIFKPPLSRVEYVGMKIIDNPWGLKSDPKLPMLQDLLNRITRKTELPAWDWFFWRNAFWMYIMTLATVIACLRLKSWKIGMLLVPVLFNALPLAIFSGGQISRYILPTLILAPMFSGYLLLIRTPQEIQDGVRYTTVQAGFPGSGMLKSAFNIHSNLQSFNELLALLTRYRSLTYEMARREITDRYTGQFFGTFWTFVHPLIVILVYVFLFNVVFVSKVGGTRSMPLDMTAYILAGIIPWLSFSEAIGKASTVIINNANLVKQVIFPIEVLPIKGVAATLFTDLIFIGIFLIYTLIAHHALLVTYLLLPLILFCQALAMIGISYILCSIGTYVRDTKDFVQVFLTLGMWFVPILYLPESIPHAIRAVLYANPTTYMIWCFQDVFYFGRIEHPVAWVVFPLLSVMVFIYGYRLFRKLKSMFGNVL